MLVRDVLRLAAENITLTQLAQEFASAADDSAPLSDDARSLLRCYRLVENEVALDYCPLEKSETVYPLAEKVQYASFTSAPVNILDVTDAQGNRLSYTLYAAYLVIPDADGAVNIRYSYAPPLAEPSDEVAFPARISARLLAAGVCAEYLLTCGRYAEAAVWEGKFRDGLRAAEVFRKKLCAIRSRRWV